METIHATKITSNYACDISSGATTNIKIMSKSPAGNQPEICDVKVFWWNQSSRIYQMMELNIWKCKIEFYKHDNEFS